MLLWLGAQRVCTEAVQGAPLSLGQIWGCVFSSCSVWWGTPEVCPTLVPGGAAVWVGDPGGMCQWGLAPSGWRLLQRWLWLRQDQTALGITFHFSNFLFSFIRFYLMRSCQKRKVSSYYFQRMKSCREKAQSVPRRTKFPLKFIGISSEKWLLRSGLRFLPCDLMHHCKTSGVAGNLLMRVVVFEFLCCFNPK